MDGNKHTKRSPTSLVIKEVHIKLARRCHWIAMPKKKEPWKYQVLERMWNNQNSHKLLARIQNVLATLENSLAYSYKVKYTLTINSAISPFGIYQREMKTCSHKYYYANIYIAAIHDHQNLETIQMSIKWWVHRHTVIHL